MMISDERCQPHDPDNPGNTTTTIIDDTTTTLPDYPSWSAGTSYLGGTYVMLDGKVFLARNWIRDREPCLLDSPCKEITDEWRLFMY